MNLNQRIEEAEANLRRTEQGKTIAEAEKAAAKRKLEEIVSQMTELGVTPETIQDEIEKLQIEVCSYLDTQSA